MGESRGQGELFPKGGDGSVIHLNGRCQIRREDNQRVVVVAGMAVAHFRDGDRAAEANVMVMLVEHGWAQQVEVARAFGCDVRTVRRTHRRYDEGGLGALGRGDGYPKGRRRDGSRDRRVAQLKAGDAAIARSHGA